MNQTIYSGDFDVRVLNENGKKFERVNRLHCRSDNAELVVDVNAELFPVKANDKLHVLLASSLSLTGEPDDGSYDPSPTHTIADNYEYVMHGRVFLMKHIENQQMEVQASFGGLLFRIRGDQQQLDQMTMDQVFYLLMRKQGDMMKMDM